MKYYAASLPVCFIDRDLSRYPSKARARKAAVAAARVLGYEENHALTRMINDLLSGDMPERMHQWFTPAQMQSLSGLNFWLGGEAITVDGSYEFNTEFSADPENYQRAFVFTDLNTGLGVVFVALKLRNEEAPRLFGITTEGEQS